MVNMFSASVFICTFLVSATRCQILNTTKISACQHGDVSCNMNGTSSSDQAKMMENARGRAINFTSATLHDNSKSNGLETGSPLMGSRPNQKEHSIDDVSMDDMDDEYNVNMTNIMSNMHLLTDMMSAFPTPSNKTISTCTVLDKVYKLGEKFNKGCEETCQCLKSEVVCSQLCKPPYHIKGRNKNLHCQEEAVEGNKCCVTLNCITPSEKETQLVDGCTYKNETHKLGSTFTDGCQSTCICDDSGRVSCKPRCHLITPNDTDNCVIIADPIDPECCKIVLCDVEEHANKMDPTVTADDTSVSIHTSDNKILTAKTLNTSSVSLNFSERTKDCNVEMSINGIHWENTTCFNNIVTGLQPDQKYYFRLKNSASNKIEVTMPTSLNQTATSCVYKGKNYKLGEEFHDGCDNFCVCEKNGPECAPIECPTDFGLDVLDPHCIEWETFPQDFVPTPPQCCPEKVHCRNNGSCLYKGESFPNWFELPVKLTGCEKRCTCEMGNITCQPMCSTISETPPNYLHCPHQAVLTRPPGEECCSMWTCPDVTRAGNESIKAVNKEQINDTLGTGSSSSTQTPTLKHTTKPTDFFKPNKDQFTNSKNSTTDKKDFYPGPFSPQYISKGENATSEYHSPKKSNHGVLTDLLTTFHLESLADQIEKDIHSNSTHEKNKKAKKPIITHFKDVEEDEEESDEDIYDEKIQDGDIFTDIFQTKNNKHKPPANPFWTIKQPEIPELMKNPNSQGPKIPYKDKETDSKNHELNPFLNKKHKPGDDKGHEVKVQENTANQFIPFTNIPYNTQQVIYPNLNQGLKYPTSEILIHHDLNPSNGGFGHKYKPSTIQQDQNQHDEYFHVLDNDAYNEDQIGQNVQYNGPPQFHHILKLNKGGIRIPNTNEHNLNVDSVLTQLHNEANNNVHLPNIMSGPVNHQHQIPNVLHPAFGFQNYHETLNTDHTSHPLLLHPELNTSPANDTNRDEIKMHTLDAVSDKTIKLVFAVPPFLVGLHGRIELRYTSDPLNNEPSTWEQQILAPPNDLIATKELEFDLGGLQPNTTYKIKISVMMHDIENAPTSPILMIKTLPSVSTTALPPLIPVEPELRVIEVNSTYAKVGWRMFSEFELQFIDGVQVRYKEIDDKVYAATPLIHRAVTSYTIEELKPDSIYEVGIFFIPFPGQTSELQAQRTIQIRTAIENDPYKFEITMEVHHIKTTSVEISWSGIPYPEDKFVNIFRAIHQSEGNREDSSSFKVAKRDSPQSILIQDLKPATRYRLWLEAYLTNGRTKKSNVKDFITKLGPPPSSSASQGKLEEMALVESNSYYGPLVGVSIVATLAVMSTVILLLILAKKHGTNKAPITSPINRKNNSSAAYDNPTYKTCENDRLSNNNTKPASIALTVFPKTRVEKEA